MTLRDLKQAILHGDSDGIVPLTEGMVAQGRTPGQILDEALTPGMSEVGELFEQGEYFVPELLVAAEAMQAAMGVLEPLLTRSDYEPRGKVVLGTVEGDLHDIGKSLVGMMLQGRGFEVIDLGISVGADAFADAAQQSGAQIVGLSALLTTTLPALEASIRAIRQRAPWAKIMVGGAPINEAYAARVEADGYAPDASRAASLALRLVEGGDGGVRGTGARSSVPS